jgi:hypothetical protein
MVVYVLSIIFVRPSGPVTSNFNRYAYVFIEKAHVSQRQASEMEVETKTQLTNKIAEDGSEKWNMCI